MKLRCERAWLALGIVLVIGTLACHTTDVFLAKAAPTATRTRTPARPTFTPLPPPTATLAPTPTMPPTPTPRPTLRPTPRPTPRPPTARPPTAGPTKPPYDYRVARIICMHSGQSFVEGLVTANSDVSSGINGVMVRMSAEAGGAPAGPDFQTVNGGPPNGSGATGGLDGYFSFIVNAYGAAAGQVRYIWVVDGSGSPKSDPNAGRAAFNDQQGDENPNACWDIQILFVRQ
jgi:hypothetical protein